MKHCKCGCEQWKYSDWGKGSPIIFCEVCDTEYRLDDLLDMFLQQSVSPNNDLPTAPAETFATAALWP